MGVLMHITHLLHIANFWKAHKAVNRDKSWAEVLPIFFFHRDGVLAIQRLTNRWTRIFGLSRVDIYKGIIKHEIWSHERIGQTLVDMQKQSDAKKAGQVVLTDEKPRYLEGPLVVVQTQGRAFIIDGRRRANVWRTMEGNYPVIIISA